MPTILNDKVVIVTGGASGIGEAASRLFSEQGGQVVIADVDDGRGVRLEEELRDFGGAAAFIRTDVSSEEDARAMVAFAVDRFGRLDCAFNNAGVAFEGKRLHELSRSSWDRNIAINLTGVFHCMKYEIEAMLARGGSIVNTASISGVVASPNGAEYNAAKHGVIGLTRNGALDYARDKIRVNAVLPGFVMTPMMEAGLKDIPGTDELVKSASLFARMGEPMEIAQSALWLLSDLASFVTGATVVVDGGYTVQ